MAPIHPSIHPTSIHPSIHLQKKWKKDPTQPFSPAWTLLYLATSRDLSLALAAIRHDPPGGQFCRAPAARTTRPSSPRSAPPSTPSRIGAQAVHQPPWLARVSAATPYSARIHHIRRRRGQRPPDPAPVWPGSTTSGDVEASVRLPAPRSIPLPPSPHLTLTSPSIRAALLRLRREGHGAVRTRRGGLQRGRRRRQGAPPHPPQEWAAPHQG